MYQKLVIIGRLGRDPEMRFTPTGQAVTNFSMATDRAYTKQDGTKVKETTWFRIETWGKTAENCNQYLKKGSIVLVEGRLKQDPETNLPRIYQAQDGTTKAANFEVVAENVRFLSSRTEGAPETEAESAPAEDIPF